MEDRLAPICLFTYNRLKETQKTIRALQNNNLAKGSDLYVFSDGWKNDGDKIKVLEVRKFLKKVSGFKSVTIYESKLNKGLANSVISGVSDMFKAFNSIIVLEDDLVTAPNFLDFMNQALLYYKNQPNIISVSGYTMNIDGLKNLESDFYFGCRASSWGWATWKNEWASIDWDVTKFKRFIKSKSDIALFNMGGSDMTKMLKNQMKGKIDSWAIRFCFQQFLDKKACVFPKISKVQSIGFSEEATNTVGAKKFITSLDTSNKQKFIFENFTRYDEDLLIAFRNKFSLRQRMLDKIWKIFNG